LEWLTLGAAFYEIAESGCFAFGQGALEVQVELHARQLENVREEQFGLQSRGLDIFFCQELGAFLNALKDGHVQSKVRSPTSKVQKNERRARGSRRAFQRVLAVVWHLFCQCSS